MLKNIEKAKEKGIEINQSHLRPELYGFDIPAEILKGLKLPGPGEKARAGSRARSMNKTFTSQGKNTNRNSDNRSALNNSAFEAYNSGQINLDGLG